MCAHTCATLATLATLPLTCSSFLLTGELNAEAASADFLALASLQYGRAYRQADLNHAKIVKHLGSIRDAAAFERFTKMESDTGSMLVDDYGNKPPDEQLDVLRAWFGKALGFPTVPVQVNSASHDGFCLFMPRVGRAHASNHRVVLDLKAMTITGHVSLRRISTTGSLEVGGSVYPRPPNNDPNGLRFSALKRDWLPDKDEHSHPTSDDPLLLQLAYPNPRDGVTDLWS